MSALFFYVMSVYTTKPSAWRHSGISYNGASLYFTLDSISFLDKVFMTRSSSLLHVYVRARPLITNYIYKDIKFLTWISYNGRPYKDRVLIYRRSMSIDKQIICIHELLPSCCFNNCSFPIIFIKKILYIRTSRQSEDPHWKCPFDCINAPRFMKLSLPLEISSLEIIRNDRHFMVVHWSMNDLKVLVKLWWERRRKLRRSHEFNQHFQIVHTSVNNRKMTVIS